MANQIFMRVNEVAEELGISIPFAYRIIRQDVYKRQAKNLLDTYFAELKK